MLMFFGRYGLRIAGGCRRLTATLKAKIVGTGQSAVLSLHALKMQDANPGVLTNTNWLLNTN